MELLANDLSMHGQFHDAPAFRDAIARLMIMRKTARRFGRELHCHRNIANAQATHELTILQAVQRFAEAERRAILSWLTQFGPFWEDRRSHGPDDYLTFGETLVTDTAVGEAAFGNFHEANRRIVSITPSVWQHSPIPVTWHRDDGSALEIDVVNYLTDAELEADLRSALPPINSWASLAKIATTRFTHLTFSNASFEPLRGHPFVGGAAHRIMELLDTLERLRTCVDEHGQRTPEGNRIYQDHFTGEKAWFAPSSNTEKNDFETELNFPHPEVKGKSLFCTWHGRVKSPQFRIHFSWPTPGNQPLYIVYVGPKLTKR